MVSEIGDHFNNIAVFSLALATTKSGLVVSGVMLSRAIPAVLAGPIAGVLLDRLDRKQVMIASDLIRGVVALGFILYRAPQGHLAAVRVQRPADVRFAVLHQRPLGHPAHHRQPGRTAHRQLAHPDHAVDHAHHRHFLAGASVMQFGYEWAFVLNSLSFLFSAWCISRLRRAERRAFRAKKTR